MCFRTYKKKYNEALTVIESLHAEIADTSAALRNAQHTIAEISEEKDLLAADLAEERAKYEHLTDNCYIRDEGGRFVHFKPEKRKPLGVATVKPAKGTLRPKKQH